MQTDNEKIFLFSYLSHIFQGPLQELRHHESRSFKIVKELLGHQLLPSPRRDYLLTE